MTKEQNGYDLEERTIRFAKAVALFIKKLPQSIANHEYSKQVIRSSGSVGANYIEANESLGKKDFLLHLKICRKESKESAYWLRLLVEINEPQYHEEGTKLYNESIELKKIFSAIINKTQL